MHGCIKPGYAGEIDTSLRVDDERVVRCEADEDGALSAKTAWECIATSVSSRSDVSMLAKKICTDDRAV